MLNLRVDVDKVIQSTNSMLELTNPDYCLSFSIVYYAENGGPEAVLLLRRFYHDPLWS